MKIAKLHIFEVEELACAITGLNYEDIDADSKIIEDALMEQFDISTDGFYDIVCRLAPLINISESPITKKLYKGFADVDNSIWLTKMEVEL